MARKRNHEHNGETYPPDRRKWYRYSFPPLWWELIHHIARRHGYNEATLWRFILLTLRRAYPDDWDVAIRYFNLKPKEADLIE